MENIQGRTFGRWTVISFDRYEQPNDFWNCQCSCGTRRIVNGKSMRHGLSRSCGCLKSEVLRSKPNAATHGLSKHPLFMVWSGMRQRCYNTRSPSFKNYGAAGIFICDRWRDNFQAFYDDCIENWKPGLAIDRIEVRGPYAPLNCRWVTRAAQMQNKRTTVFVEMEGEKLCLSEALRRYGRVSWKTARLRILRGWSDFDSVTKPPTTTK